MPIAYRCPNPDCRKKYTAADALAGRPSRCKRCGTTHRIPQPGAEAAFDLEDAEPAPPHRPASPPPTRRWVWPVAGAVAAVAAVAAAWWGIAEWRATPRVAEAGVLAGVVVTDESLRPVDGAPVGVRLSRPPEEAAGYRLVGADGKAYPAGTHLFTHRDKSVWLVFAVPRRELAGPLTLIAPGDRRAALPPGLTDLASQTEGNLFPVVRVRPPR